MVLNLSSLPLPDSKWQSVAFTVRMAFCDSLSFPFFACPLILSLLFVAYKGF